MTVMQWRPLSLDMAGRAGIWIRAMKGNKALDIHSRTFLLTPWPAHPHHYHKETWKTALQLLQHLLQQDLAAI